MLYERKIVYLDYNVRGERCGVGGFIKLERRDGVCNIALQINILEMSASYGVKAFLVGEQEKEFCNLELIGGKATIRFKEENISDICGTGIAYDEIIGIRILLNQDREIWGKIGDKRKSTEGQVLSSREEKSGVQIEENVIAAEVSMDEEEHTWEVTHCEEKQPKTLWVEEDKWHQLWDLYPHIIPFQDEREYLAIGPNDFVILPGKYFCMANNSFLLHGYNNYKHLVLKKTNQHGEEKYYIGVPGNFYDREKQVAVMFGFEGFESMKEPASPGDYGYYMMRIEL